MSLITHPAFLAGALTAAAVFGLTSLVMAVAARIRYRREVCRQLDRLRDEIQTWEQHG